MTTTNNCPFCSRSMTPSYLYVRGISAALLRSSRPDVGLLSRKDLTLIDLRDASLADPGAQGVIPALHCESCDSMSFKTSK